MAPYPRDRQDIANRLSPPSRSHLFGTDQLGRDILSRVLYSGRISLPVGVGVVAIASIVGSTLGAAAGYWGGFLDELIMRVVDLLLSFPPIILALAVAAALGPDLKTSMIGILAVWWPQYARLIRGTVQSIKQEDYTLASRAIGAGHWRILTRTVLPNAIIPPFVMAVLDVGSGISVAATLSFLGLGVQPPTPDWGSMVANGARYLEQWWIALFPGLAIATVVMGFNLFGDFVRDFLDPRSRSGT